MERQRGQSGEYFAIHPVCDGSLQGLAQHGVQETEYAALRLAEWELGRATLSRHTTADDFVISRFNHNVAKLTKSWELVKPMSLHTRTAPLAELSQSELQALVSQLSAGWGVEASVPSSVDWKNLEMVWVTPTMRE